MCDMRNRSLLLLGFLAFGLGMNAKTYVDPATGKTLCSTFDEKREGAVGGYADIIRTAFGKHNSMNSFNHYSFGAVATWMYNYSLGIRRDETSPGFKHLRNIHLPFLPILLRQSSCLQNL